MYHKQDAISFEARKNSWRTATEHHTQPAEIRSSRAREDRELQDWSKTERVVTSVKAWHTEFNTRES